MSKFVAGIIGQLEDLKTEDFLCERTTKMAELVRTTLNSFDEFHSIEDDHVCMAGTIELEIELSSLYYKSWSSEDRIDEDFNSLIDETIKVLTHHYIN